ncbi:3-oxoacyl-[acyl-carrier protein] reductase [Rhodoligotrophos appendicifer]|uniref:SDR family NAD(P)-dependent oxidoreductase n=1 Tax=Rhodoligotrophos appendicifer TaxID=987056 RepID=UPI00117C8B78|nr:SDR family NAD(P)-dependent oxidoreductase [Rhodoligotrophos appendicifer]
MKLAVVTGAAAGIGKACAVALARSGMAVLILDKDPAAVEQSVRSIRSESSSDEITGQAVDLTDESATRTILSGLDEVWCLVNNAGVFEEKPFQEISGLDFDRMLNIHLKVPASLSQLLVPKMRDGGRIVNIVSRSILGARNYSHYVAAKNALAGLTKCMAIELADQRILVNAIAPGLIETGIFERMTAEQKDHHLSMQPGRQIGKPSDVAHLVSFLASPETQFITGQTIFIDGGRSLGAR